MISCINCAGLVLEKDAVIVMNQYYTDIKTIVINSHGPIHPKPEDCEYWLMGKAVTSQNYIGHYTTWCLRNAFSPLGYDVLHEIFLGCETNEDYADTLEGLYIVQTEGFKLSFMKDKNTIDALTCRLQIRLELFKRIPSATNMLLAYNLVEELTLKHYSQGADLSDEVNKNIERFDKLKALALDTKYIHERQLAFNRSIEIFKKLTQIKL